MKSHPFYLFFKKPLVAGISVFIILLVIAQIIAYQKYLINENEQKKEVNSHVD